MSKSKEDVSTLILRLRELLEKATPGPWAYGSNEFGSYIFGPNLETVLSGDDSAHDDSLCYTNESDIDLTVAAVNALPTLLSRLEEQQSPQWLPIESAPKDGTAILIFEPDGKRELHMPRHLLGPKEFSYKSDDPRLVHYDDRRFAIGYWRPFGGGWGNRNASFVNPTHWMPLPASPVIDNREGDL